MLGSGFVEPDFGLLGGGSGALGRGYGLPCAFMCLNQRQLLGVVGAV